MRMTQIDISSDKGRSGGWGKGPFPGDWCVLRPEPTVIRAGVRECSGCVCGPCLNRMFRPRPEKGQGEGNGARPFLSKGTV